MKDGDVLQIKAELIRHGEWDYEKRRFTAEGKKKVEELARYLADFNGAISSTTIRAIETAKTLSRDKIKINTNPVLNEIPGFEKDEVFSPELAMRRAQQALRFIFAKMSEQKAGGNILFVSHAAMVGAVQFLIENKKPKTIDDLYLFDTLTGIDFSMNVRLSLSSR